jgi:hypothetical protein
MLYHILHVIEAQTRRLPRGLVAQTVEVVLVCEDHTDGVLI